MNMLFFSKSKAQAILQQTYQNDPAGLPLVLYQWP
jgi:hypothetical protein